MTLRAFAAALLLGRPGSGRAQPLGVQQTLLGSSAKRLAVGALRHLQAEGRTDDCLVGLASVINIHLDPRMQGTRAGYYNSYIFYFFSPTKPFAGVEVIEAVSTGPDSPTLGAFNEYSTVIIGKIPRSSELTDTSDSCIDDLPVDSGPAIVAAGKAGLPRGEDNQYRVNLRRAASPLNRDWADKALRGRTYWMISDVEPQNHDIGRVNAQGYDEKRLPQFLIDAKTGKLLKKRSAAVFIP